MTPGRIEIKICGLATPETAVLCATAGADAIGLVFHAPSPRNVTPERAAEIAAAVPAHVARVGVFAAQDAAAILAIAATAGLTAVQLHGPCAALPAAPFLAAGLRPVYVLCAAGDELVRQARTVPAEAGVLVECGRGVLPGGNGAAWAWSEAAALAGVRPFAIAGGLDAASVAAAVAVSGATAVDVSSGVESAPGRKDPARIRAFIAAARAAGDARRPAPAGQAVFRGGPA